MVYFEIRGDEYVIERDYTAGVRALAGRYPVAAFGPALLTELLEGRTVIEADATTEPDRTPGERAAFAAIQVRGHVDVPLVKGSRFVAGMTVQISDRRVWTRQEVAIIEDTAERTWAAVERVRAEAALRSSEESRRLALDAAELGTFNIDPATNALTSDERFRIIFAGTTRALDYEEAFAAAHPDDRKRIREAVAAATRIDDPAPYSEEYRVIHPDGSVRWVFAKGRATFAGQVSSRQLVSFNGTVADITARKLAEAALRESEERLEFVRRSSGVGFWYCDLPFDILQWDELVKAHFHLPPDAVVTIQVFYDRIHPCDREPTRQAIERSIASRTPYDTDYRTLNPDSGAVKWVRAIGRTFYAADGTPIRFDGVTLDVSEQKRAEASLRESEERYRSVVAQVQEHAIFATDMEGRATTWNEGVRRVLGFEEADFIGQDIVTAIFTPEDVAKGVAQRELDMAAATGSAGDDRWMMRKDGTRFWAAGIMTARRAEDGRLLGFSKVMRDMTTQKAMENNLRQLATELSEANRRKDEFLATLAHELRNPLAPIRNGLQIIRTAGANGPIEQARSMMERQLMQLVRLVDDLLDMSRVTSGKLELRRTRFELRTVIDAAVETSRPVIEEAGHQLTVAMPEERIWVDGDHTRLAQVVSNLLNNSAKYMHRGGHVRLKVGLKEDMAVVSVADDGIGIPPTMLDKVFEMFTQVDRSLEKTSGGLGVGLSLVKGLVEMHGGTVKAYSGGEGLGSEFVVRLPVVLPAVQKVEPPKAVEPVRSSGHRRILIADDNMDAAESLAILLELQGNDVNIANDGLKALEVAETFRPDVILLDIGMPKLNGYETCRRIREQPWGKNAILIALTGWGQDEDKRRSQEAGFDHHMVKPVDDTAVMKLLASRFPGV